MKKLLVVFFALLSLYSFAQETINDKTLFCGRLGSLKASKCPGRSKCLCRRERQPPWLLVPLMRSFATRSKQKWLTNILRIYFDGDKLSFNMGNKKLRAYVSVTTLTSLQASGASSFKISGTISGNSLDVKLTGASDINGDIKFSKLTADISGASQVKLTGTVENADIDASGASDVKSYDLAADECSVNATGASDIRLTVNKEISAHATGASSIFYKGDAVMKNVHTTGASSVAKKT